MPASDEGAIMEDEDVDVAGGTEHWSLPGGGATGLLSLNAAAAAKAGRQRPTNNALLYVVSPLRKIRPTLYPSRNRCRASGHISGTT